jgi:hypothetical protein
MKMLGMLKVMKNLESLTMEIHSSHTIRLDEYFLQFIS